MFLFDRRVRGDTARICLLFLWLDVSTVRAAVPGGTKVALVLTKLVSPGGAGEAVVSKAAAPGGAVVSIAESPEGEGVVVATYQE